MKRLKQCLRFSGILLVLPFLTGCAAGSFAAGYAFRAREADCLTAEGEERITNRVKREIMHESQEEESSVICY